jgi:DNA mismatch endonuclease (patch repair protein)
MRATPQKDTPTEMRLRSSLYRLGLRFRIHKRVIKELSRTADIIFSRAKVAVFVDGCFWHGCSLHGTIPKTNRKWWFEKIDTNRQRDSDTVMRLDLVGWKAVRIWEHEDPDVAALKIAAIIQRQQEKTQPSRDVGT